MASPATTARPSFRNRSDAGKLLAQSLSRYATQPGVVVLGLARGGIPVAREVSDALGATLGLFVSRKFGLPGVEEVALGAIAEGTRRVFANAAAQYIGAPARLIEQLATRERADLERRAALYHARCPLPDLRGRVVILVDDALVTGVTLRAAAHVVRRAAPARLIAAVPVASEWGSQQLGAAVDEIVAVVSCAELETLATAFEDYPPITDDDVLKLLGRAIRRVPSTALNTNDRFGMALLWGDDHPRDHERVIAIPVAGGAITADLGMPSTGVFPNTTQLAGRVLGLAILAHEDAASRRSFVNRYIAARLRLGGYATLRLDLLTASEQRRRAEGASFGLDPQRLATRIAAACDWASHERIGGAARITLISAGSAAAAALLTAARRDHVRAVAVRGGRVDLVRHTWSELHASVLLVAGADDRMTIRGYETALRELPSDTQLITVPHASHAVDAPQAVGSLAERLLGWLDRVERMDRRRPRRSSGE